MGLIETASGNSVWRGMDYYEQKSNFMGKDRGNHIQRDCSRKQWEKIYS